jgi:hypothetical protein
MPHEVTSYAADNRTFNAAACRRITWESECYGGNTEKSWNQKRFFHEFLLVQVLKPLTCPLVPARGHVFIFGRGSPCPKRLPPSPALTGRSGANRSHCASPKISRINAAVSVGSPESDFPQNGNPL